MIVDDSEVLTYAMLLKPLELHRTVVGDGRMAGQDDRELHPPAGGARA